ncbi:hypothetical protein LTR37_013861 [Vermiconidia calcicola]|uniref:Uncharacterized protein n=1 Tax=Vermiconidia calcicola TaxID=1690605 RepID=A0ACC3MVF2_9PEZI|nr:hypothetical protein LTR37_013861 [Vermiconidia calcicola]
MAVTDKPTYVSIPPPPLPEFYLPKKSRKKGTRSSSSSSVAVIDVEALVIKESPISGDGVYDGKPRGASLAYPSAPLVAMPPFASNVAGHDVPPLAIYHICRICLRPRSPRYHREHPIPIDGVPPPPGICRRCRVTSVEEINEVAEVVTESESNEIKIGCITPFVRDEDIISNEEMRRMKYEKYLKGIPDNRHQTITTTHRRRSSSGRDIVYRHIRVVEDADEPEPERRRKKVVLTAQDAIENFNDEPPPVPPIPPQAPRGVTMSMQVQPTKNPASLPARTMKSAAIRRMDSTNASVSTQASSRSGSPSIAQASAKVTTRSRRPSHTESDIRRIAREEVETYGKTGQKPERSESDVRRISREEVARYREAERKLEAHPDAYAHGRLVPVKRRIAVEKDVVETVPWSKPAEKTPARTVVATHQRSHSEDRVSKVATETKKGGQAQGRADEQSWGPKCRRELSIERRNASDYEREVFITSDGGPVIGQKRTSAAAPRDSEPPGSGKLRAVYDAVRQIRSPRPPPDAESYMVEIVRGPEKKKYEVKAPAKDKYEVTKVSEEIGIPVRSRAASYRRPDAETRTPLQPGSPVPVRFQDQGLAIERQQVRNQASPPLPPLDEDRLGTWSRSSRPTDREYWYDEATVRTADTQSSKRRGGVALQQTEPQAPPPKTDSSSKSWARDPVDERSTQVSDKTYWPSEQVARKTPREPQSSAKGDAPYSNDNVVPDRDTASAKQRTEKPSRADAPKGNRRAKDNDTEYIYTERIVQPADRPYGWRPFDDAPPAHGEVVEDTIWRRRPAEQAPQPEQRQQAPSQEQRKQPADRPFGWRPSDDAPPAHAEVVEDTVWRRRPAEQAPQQKQHEQAPPQEQRKQRRHRRHHISPTPPGSDASSSEFRSFHSFGRGNTRQIDGHQDSEAEYERRGRARSRDTGVEFFYGWASQHEREHDRDATVRPKKNEGDKKGVISSSRWVAGGRPLERAFSESPSREGSVDQSRQDTTDGRGPYRPEQKVTDSMRPHDGSRESRTWTSDAQAHRGDVGGNAQMR